MKHFLTANQIKAKAAERGLPMMELYRLAGVHPSIFARWRAGRTKINVEAYERLVAVVLNEQRDDEAAER